MNEVISHARNGGLPVEAAPERAIPPSYKPVEAIASARPEEPGLGGYFTLLRRRWRTMTLAALIGASAGFLVAKSQHSLYPARASLELQGLNSDFMNLRQVDPNSPPPNYTTSDAYLQTQIRILTSDTLIDRAVASMKQKGQFFTEPADPLQVLKDLFDTGPHDPVKRTVKKLAENLTVRGAAGQARVIEIRVDCFNPQMAADFVTTLAAEYIRQEKQARLDATKDTSQWLIQQTDELRGKLTASEDRLNEYARQVGLLFTSGDNSLSEEKLRQLEQYQQLLSAAHENRKALEAHLERARGSSSDSLPEVLADRTVRDAKKTLIELNRQLAELTAQYGSGDSRVAVVQAQVASVEKTLAQQKQTILDRIRRDEDEAVAREKQLEETYDGQKRQVTEHAEKSIRYKILKREMDTNRQLYEGILQKVKEAEFASAMNTANVRLIDGAKVPEKPDRPSRVQYTAFGLLAGLLLGLTWVVSSDNASHTLRKPGDAIAFVNLTELGAVPLSAGPEAFRSILLSILYSDGRLHAPRTLVINAVSPDGGNSLVAENLALAFAAIERRVLLADSAGITALVRNNSSLDIAAAGMIQQRIRNLFVVTATDAAADVVQHADAVEPLLQRLRDQFDIIIVDTPPLTQSPDARVFGRAADSVILLARLGHTTPDALALARDRLAEDGIRVLGVILSDWDDRA